MIQTTILPLEANLGGFKAYFNAVAISCGGGLVLVDTGLPGFLETIEDTMARAGLKLCDVKKIIITHQDGDHIGSLKAILDKYPDIEVLCSGTQAPGITGKQKLLRLIQFDKRLESVTDEKEKAELAEERKRLGALQTIGKVTVVSDGEVLGDCGIEIIEIEGHMPGHICVYVKADKALITGDALTAWEGKLCPPDTHYTMDLPKALKSVEKLLNYEIENVICYHGGLITGNIKERLEEISKTGK